MTLPLVSLQHHNLLVERPQVGFLLDLFFNLKLKWLKKDHFCHLWLKYLVHGKKDLRNNNLHKYSPTKIYRYPFLFLLGFFKMNFTQFKNNVLKKFLNRLNSNV